MEHLKGSLSGRWVRRQQKQQQKQNITKQTHPERPSWPQLQWKWNFQKPLCKYKCLSIVAIASATFSTIAPQPTKQPTNNTPHPHTCSWVSKKLTGAGAAPAFANAIVIVTAAAADVAVVVYFLFW